MILEGFDKNCRELLDEISDRQSKHCFNSAFYHLEKAYQLLSLDKEMTVFRAITAEEEAATGLMYCLRELNYPNSSKLKIKDHMYKNAVIQFIKIVIDSINSAAGNTIKSISMRINRDSASPFLDIGIPLRIGRSNYYGWPVPPLNVCATSGGLRLSYRKQLTIMLEGKGRSHIISYMKELANQRNKVLYASPQGMPKMKSLSENYINDRRVNVLIMLKVYLLIVPYTEHQPMVQDCLDAFLEMCVSGNYDGFHEEL